MKHKRTQPEPVFFPLIKQAFVLNKSPFPWSKSLLAGLCAALPVMIGMLFGSLQYGLLAGIGGFTYLYVFHIPYAQRAKKLFFAFTGIAAAVGLGTLLAPYPLGSALMVGFIGMSVTFIFGALKITGPAAIFFVLVFLLSTGMPVDPGLAPLRVGLVLLGGIFSWSVAMVGFLFNPHGPETAAVNRAYAELADFLEAVGTERLSEQRHRFVSVLNAAENTLLAGYIPLRTTDHYKRIFLLIHQAHDLYSDILEHVHEQDQPLPKELSKLARVISDAIDPKGVKAVNKAELPESNNTHVQQLAQKLDRCVRILKEPVVEDIKISKPSLMTVFAGAFDKHSIVFLTSVRFGIVLAIAAIIAISFDFNRSYWIPLSCAAVMSGATIIATFHRAIQRSVGTMLGILIASSILFFHPESYMIPLLIFLFTFLTELAIVFNYAVAALFITPNALLLAESTTQMHNVPFFASARVVDVLIGSAIGLLGTLLISRRHASNLLPLLMAKTIRSQQQFILALFSEYGKDTDLDDSIENRKMQTNLTNLRIVYNTALGELSKNRSRTELFLPVIFSIEQLGYLLEASTQKDRPALSDQELAQLMLAFEVMAKSAEQQRAFSQKPIPELKDFKKLQKEIHDLQHALTVSMNADAT